MMLSVCPSVSVTLCIVALNGPGQLARLYQVIKVVASCL